MSMKEKKSAKEVEHNLTYLDTGTTLTYPIFILKKKRVIH